MSRELLLVSHDAVSRDSGVKDMLEKFLGYSMEFYSKLPSIVESQLSFKVSELVHSGVEFSSKTHWRKVRPVGWGLYKCSSGNRMFLLCFVVRTTYHSCLF